MKPVIQLHRIAETRMEPIREYEHTDGPRKGEKFYARRLTVTDAADDSFEIMLFSETRDGLTLVERGWMQTVRASNEMATADE